jgi:hypothetical protein
MELKKAEIKPLKGDKITVLFNPNQYQVSESNQFAEVAIPGVGAPPLQFVRGTARTLSMQLFFDTYDPMDPDKVKPGSDVREYTGEIIKLLEVDSDLHSPPICRFSWASFAFVGVLEKADQRFTLFLPDGTPVRATVDVTFKELGQQQEKQAAGKLRSADFAKRYAVRRGDTLSNIAAEEYGDPGLWRPIAEENGLDSPLDIEPGQVLVIPALE